MDFLTLFIMILLGVAVLALIFYPLWQQTRSDAIFQVDRAGQTLEEHQARYQALLASIRELMFDYEMGKVSADDYEILLDHTKLEAAQVRQHIDRLTQFGETAPDPALEADIEAAVAQLRREPDNRTKGLLKDVDAQIRALQALSPAAGALACPHCGKIVQADDAFCTGCGQAVEVIVPAAGCPDCGAPVQPDDAFCARCGAALTAEVAV